MPRRRKGISLIATQTGLENNASPRAWLGTMTDGLCGLVAKSALGASQIGLMCHQSHVPGVRNAVVPSRCILSVLFLLLASLNLRAEYTIVDAPISLYGGSTQLQLLRVKRNQGHVDAALSGLRKMVQADLKEPARRLARVELVDTLVGIEFDKPTGERDWKAIGRVLLSFENDYPGDAGFTIRKLKITAAMLGPDGKAGIVGRLQALEKQFVMSHEFWVGAHDLYNQFGESRRADLAIARRESLPRSNPNEILAQNKSASEQAEDRFQAILGFLSDFRRHLGNGDASSAVSTLNQWSERFPSASQPKQLLLGFLVSLRDQDSLRSVEAKWARDEGQTGPFARQARMNRLLLEAEDGDNSALSQVTTELAHWLEKENTNPDARALLGAAHEISGDFLQSIASYRAALRLYSRNTELVRSLLGLLYVTDQLTAAEEVLSELDEDVIQAPSVLPLAVRLYIKLGNTQQALGLARHAVDATPTAVWAQDAMASAYLTMPEQVDSADRSMECLANSIELQATNPIRWASAVWGQLHQGQIDTTQVARFVYRFAALLRAYETDLPDAWEMLVVARCLELEGSLIEAERYYRAASQSDVDGVVRRWIPIGSLVTRLDRSRGSQLATHINARSDLPENAAVVGITPDIDKPELDLSAFSDSVQQTVELLQLAVDRSPFDREEALGGDTRLQAIALLGQAAPDAISQASTRLQETPSAQMSAADSLFLARLDRTRQPEEKVILNFEDALRKNPNREQLLEIFEESLAIGKLDLGSRAASMLRLQDPATAQERTLRLMLAEERFEEAIDFSKQNITDAASDQKLELTRTLAQRIAAAGQTDAALELITDQFRNHPAFERVRTDLLSRIPGRSAESIDGCEAMAANGQATIAALLAIRTALLAPHDSSITERVDNLIAGASKSDRSASGFLVFLFQLREVQGRIDEAESAANEALGSNPADYVHNNSLAWMLAAYRQRGEDALEQINRAIRRGGPRDEFLDTKAVALITEGRNQEAASVLQQLLVTSTNSPPPVTLALHILAADQQRQADAGSSLEAWTTSHLSGSVLGPFDAELARRLR